MSSLRDGFTLTKLQSSCGKLTLHHWEHFRSSFIFHRSIYSDESLGAANLRMIELAREHGSAAKFPGSGGAVIGLCLDSLKMVNPLSRSCMECTFISPLFLQLTGVSEGCIPGWRLCLLWNYPTLEFQCFMITHPYFLWKFLRASSLNFQILNPQSSFDLWFISNGIRYLWVWCYFIAYVWTWS